MKKNEERKPLSIRFLVSKTELATIKKNAEAAKRTMADYIRLFALEGKIK
jgi:hypothetical protein